MGFSIFMAILSLTRNKVLIVNVKTIISDRGHQ